MGREQQDPEEVAGSTGAGGERVSEAWTLPIRDGRWTDDNSHVEWRIRGRGVEPGTPALRRLLNRPDLRVLHAYGPRPLEVAGREREALLERVARFHDGDASPHSAFLLAEFRNASGGAMLVIQEMC